MRIGRALECKQQLPKVYTLTPSMRSGNDREKSPATLDLAQDYGEGVDGSILEDASRAPSTPELTMRKPTGSLVFVRVRLQHGSLKNAK
jgi:hypothetical protein